MKDKQKFLEYFRHVQVRFSGLYAKNLADADMSLPQYALLNLLGITGPATMTEASRALGITKPAVTNLVDRLEEKNYLKRVAHPRDRRITLLQIQPRADKTVQKIQQLVLHVLVSALEQFNPREQAIMVNFYQRLAETLEESAKQKRRGKKS